VQVGDPFEKLLIEATLESSSAAGRGDQDLGAAGITCGVSETADRAGTGILVDLDAIHRREPGMVPFEVMISGRRNGWSPSSGPNGGGVEGRLRPLGVPCAVIGPGDR